MSRKYPFLLAIPALLLIGGCTETAPADTDDGSPVLDIPVADLVDVQDDDGDNDIRRDVPPDPGSDQGMEDTTFDPCAQKPYGFGCICDSNPDCSSEFCIAVPGENYHRCTRNCYDDCPDGWLCQQEYIGSDAVWMCIPTYDPLCDRGCLIDSDCQSAGALCVASGNAKYCLQACEVDEDCVPKNRVKECDNQGNCAFDGELTEEQCLEDVFCEVVNLEFECVEVTNVEGTTTSKQCMPTSGHCECSAGTDYTSDPNHCGDCETKCSYAHATADCQNSVCKKGGCLAGWVDLNGNPDDGCEYECLWQAMDDHPDSGYVDANCDGIDGDATYGVFVQNGGDDENTQGSMAYPFATINAAILFAASKTPIPEVYVAGGTYNEQVNLVNGVSVYGGYDAGNGWSRNLTTNLTYILWGNQEGLAVRSVVARDINLPTVFDGFRIKTDPAALASGSSYGMYVSGCDSDLVISNNYIEAGNGFAGRNGTYGMNGQAGGNGTKGSDAFVYDACGVCFTCTKFDFNTYMKPGPGGSNSCSATGGNGGKGGKIGDGGLAGTAGIDGGGAGGAGAPYEEDDGSPGIKGADGDDGAEGSSGLATGEIVGGLWVPLAGGDGSDGSAGKGGGGGGGGGGDDDAAVFGIECYSAGGAGGGGGGGGCGGSAGTGGLGGGGSFGLFLVQSSPTITGNTLLSWFGGTGGVGGIGGAGGQAGLPGAGGAATADGAGAGAAGGLGGSGGDGGSGGGGPGGPSYSLYIVGNSSNPTCSDNVYNFRQGGAGGMNGAGTVRAQTGDAGKIFGVTAKCTAE